MIKTILVPVDRRMQRVPVLTSQHLKAYQMITAGTDIDQLIKDRRMRRIVSELCRLGWVEPRSSRRPSNCG